MTETKFIFKIHKMSYFYNRSFSTAQEIPITSQGIECSYHFEDLQQIICYHPEFGTTYINEPRTPEKSIWQAKSKKDKAA